MAWAGRFGQEKKIRQLNIFQCVAKHQKYKNSRKHNSKFSHTLAISTPVSTSQISTRFHHLEIYPWPISVLNSLHVTYSFQSSLFYYPWSNIQTVRGEFQSKFKPSCTSPLWKENFTQNQGIAKTYYTVKTRSHNRGRRPHSKFQGVILTPKLELKF